MAAIPGGGKFCHRAVALEEWMVLIGGNSQDCEPCRRVYAYQTKKNLWTEWPPTPTTCCGAAVYNQSLLAIGGEPGGRDVFVLNDEHTKWTGPKTRIPPMPIAVTDCAATVFEEKLYVCGGSEEHHGVLQVFDFRLREWFVASPAPRAACRNWRIYALVPIGRFLVTDEWCCYDTEKDTWRRVPARPAGKATAVTSLKGHLIALGQDCANAAWPTAVEALNNGGSVGAGIDDNGSDDSSSDDSSSDDSSSDDSGSDDNGSDGSGDSSSDGNGRDGNGTDDRGRDDSSSDDNGSDNNGSDDNGSDDNGSDDNGSDDSGSDDNGGDNNGSDDADTDGTDKDDSKDDGGHFGGSTVTRSRDITHFADSPADASSGESKESSDLFAADALSYDFHRWMPLPNMHAERRFSSACTVNGKVYVSGGELEPNSLESFC